MSSDGAWKLRAELLGHEQDVRGINNCDAGLVTCSRDKTIRVWTPVDARAFESAQILIGHEHFVACAVQLPASPAHPRSRLGSDLAPSPSKGGNAGLRGTPKYRPTAA